MKTISNSLTAGTQQYQHDFLTTTTEFAIRGWYGPRLSFTAVSFLLTSHPQHLDGINTEHSNTTPTPTTTTGIPFTLPGSFPFQSWLGTAALFNCSETSKPTPHSHNLVGSRPVPAHDLMYCVHSSLTWCFCSRLFYFVLFSYLHAHILLLSSVLSAFHHQLTKQKSKCWLQSLRL